MAEQKKKTTVSMKHGSTCGRSTTYWRSTLYVGCCRTASPRHQGRYLLLNMCKIPGSVLSRDIIPFPVCLFLPLNAGLFFRHSPLMSCEGIVRRKTFTSLNKTTHTTKWMKLNEKLGNNLFDLQYISVYRAVSMVKY